MQCRQCGTEIAEKAIICYKCGTATAIPDARPSGRSRASRRGGLPAWIWVLIAAAVVAAAWWRFR
jgi:hypothetical protein